MGKFDGILICSDFDGTIFTGKTVPDDTKTALEYFMNEGGKFCICTGRGPEFLVEMSQYIRGNTYSICYGGALVCDIWSGEVLREGFIDDDAFDVIDGLLSSDAETVRINMMRPNAVIDRYTPDEYLQSKSSISPLAYKITLNGKTDEDGKVYKKYAKEHPNTKYTLGRSFASYTEIMKTDQTKGYSARLLKEHIGANTLIGIGDYENDIPLFREVDVSYAVGNAVDELKAIATRTVTETVSTGAAAAIIKDIENNLI